MIFILIILILFASASAAIVFLFGVLLPNLEQRDVSIENPLMFSAVSYVGEPDADAIAAGIIAEHIPVLVTERECKMVQTLHRNESDRKSICAQFAECVAVCPRLRVGIAEVPLESESTSTEGTENIAARTVCINDHTLDPLSSVCPYRAEMDAVAMDAENVPFVTEIKRRLSVLLRKQPSGPENEQNENTKTQGE
jgi:hypothetical protein